MSQFSTFKEAEQPIYLFTAKILFIESIVAYLKTLPISQVQDLRETMSSRSSIYKSMTLLFIIWF
jgi:hypothetical protein